MLDVDRNSAKKPERLNSPFFASPTLNAAQALVSVLEEKGVELAVGIPGGAVSAIFTALSRSGRIRTRLAQHEAGAAYTALGASWVRFRSRNEKKPLGLCYATSGPGITNLITGVAAAYEERVPIFVLTGNVATGHFGKFAAQDASPGGIDAVRMLEPVTARSVCATSAGHAVRLAAELYDLACETGLPVHLNVPLDLALAECAPPPFSPQSEPRPNSGDPSPVADPALWERFVRSERPLVFCGSGVKTAHTTETLVRLVEKHQIPVLVSSHAKSAFPEDHPLFRGIFGFAAPPAGPAFLESYAPDALLALGTRLGETSTAGWSPLLTRPALRIQVDRDPRVFGQSLPITHPIQAELGPWLTSALALPVAPTARRLPERAPEVSPRIYASESAIHPLGLMQVLEEVLPREAWIFCDIGNSMAWAIHALRLGPKQGFYVPMGLGAMGSGLGTALGAKLACPERPVIALVGDCAMLMHGSEIISAREAGAALKVLVLNDSGHGMVDHGLKLLGSRENPSVRLDPPVDFVSFAQSLGVRGVAARSLSALLRLPLDALLASPEPVVFDLRIDPGPVPPIASRNRVLGMTERPGQSPSARPTGSQGGGSE
jgi:acetolactate synthase-1/2/3 large subunit